VLFLGHIAEEEKEAHYRLADAFVMPGRGEGFGIVYLEALACGVPVVASSLDASQEAVMGGQLGAVVDPADGDHLVAAITNALQQRSRDRPAELEFFSVERFHQRWTEFLAVTIPQSAAGD
jgi:glycosyltransferase involved in cell wall biosynthesis